MHSTNDARPSVRLVVFSIGRVANGSEIPVNGTATQNTAGVNWNGREVVPAMLSTIFGPNGIPPSTSQSGTNQANPNNPPPDFIQHLMRDLLGAILRNGQVGGDVVLNSHSEQEKAYQDQLKQFVKTAFITIHNDETLASYLSEKGSAEEGKEALTYFYSDIYTPLAHYSELLELEAQEITCPEKFDHTALQESCGKRHSEITEAKTLLTILPENEKPILIKRLMQGCSFTFDEGVSEEAKERINTLFLKIGALAGPLHQGKLLSRESFAADTLEASGENLFQKGCQEAMEELNAS